MLLVTGAVADASLVLRLLVASDQATLPIVYGMAFVLGVDAAVQFPPNGVRGRSGGSRLANGEANLAAANVARSSARPWRGYGGSHRYCGLLPANAASFLAGRGHRCDPRHERRPALAGQAGGSARLASLTCATSGSRGRGG
jgi:hypothetical protein